MAVQPIQIQTSASAATHSTSTGCACGHADESEIVLDTRQIPHAIRHATIFGALGSLQSGVSMDLVANHNPLPLLAQLGERMPEAFEISYLEEGPDLWKLRFTRN